ncbi:methionyl-tRNA formyltransferase [Candidatus Kaiserbacteria bacterium]|nr:methionyl-tRNA formyltransferase [Candidatus Kaiserbacteria bacterium]
MHYSIVFFGTDKFPAIVLDELKKAGLLPTLIITAPDRKKGRGMKLTSPLVKLWAQENGIECLQPETLDGHVISTLNTKPHALFIVAAYGKILPKGLLQVPEYGVLNVHPSLLPRLRGASPIRSTILNDEKETGVSIMLVDEKIDHGPIVAQEKVTVEDWPPRASELEEALARKGGALLAEVLPKWIEGKITSHEQEHENATFSKKIRREDGLIDLNGDAYQNLLKIRAFDGWPGTYFFVGGKRIKITDAEVRDGKLEILRVIPEGKKEMSYKTFLKTI